MRTLKLPLTCQPSCEAKVAASSRSLVGFPFLVLSPESADLSRALCLCLLTGLDYRSLQCLVQAYIGEQRKTQGIHHIVTSLVLCSLFGLPSSFQLSGALLSWSIE